MNPFNPTPPTSKSQADALSPESSHYQTRSRGQLDDIDHIGNFPMMKDPGNNGPMLVFRRWSDRDIDEAMHHVTSPTDNCQRFETTFRQFVGEYRPTMLELQDFLFVSVLWQPLKKLCLPHVTWWDTENSHQWFLME
ncbi:hypothetical protein NQZ68_016172 [Dissostichus eleginoides]|nr:hypothetical protein NQZ68_016172 [Dissostichus eleginoides]